MRFPCAESWPLLCQQHGACQVANGFPRPEERTGGGLSRSLPAVLFCDKIQGLYQRAAMALIVQKYGGTSVGTTERIRSVAGRIAKFKAAGHQLVVVVSAMSGETDRIISLAK